MLGTTNEQTGLVWEGLRMSYARVSILGATPGGEVWSINPVFDPTGEFPGWNQGQADAACVAINALTIPASLLSLMSANLSVTGCRIEVRNDADDSLIGVAENQKSTPKVGTGGALMPAQCAIVVSLRSDTPGPSGRGRIYWPAVGATIGNALRLSGPLPATIGADMKTYLSSIEGALTASFAALPFDLAVRSRTRKTTPHINRLQVGDVIDTQRRRRDNLPESYVTTAY